MAARKRVRPELTPAEAEALWTMAHAGLDTCRLDGPETLGLTRAQMDAGARAISKINAAPTRAVAVVLTQAEADALWSAADENLVDTSNLHPSEAAAGNRALDKLAKARH